MNRVVVIDDDAAVLASLEALFTTADYEVEAFALAAHFLAALGRLPPACIIADLRMPDLDGLTLIHHLKVDLGLSWPVIAISAHADAPRALAARNAGAVDFLVKPFTPQKLLSTVKACWAGRHQPAGFTDTPF